MPSRPARPAASHTSLETMPSRSHCSWWGATSLAMNERIRSRNAACSSVKMSRSTTSPLGAAGCIATETRGAARALSSGRAGLGQVGVPLRVAVVACADQPPVHAAGHRGHAPERPAQLLDQPVGLAVIARAAGGDAVLPGVPAAPAARYDMVDGFGAMAAVSAQVVVPAHQRG